MSIEHDEEWLKENNLFHPESGVNEAHDWVEYAKYYQEYMSRWRPMSKPPEQGQWIEVLCNRMGDIHSITYGPARFNDTDLGWRPAMPLPELPEVG